MSNKVLNFRMPLLDIESVNAEWLLPFLKEATRRRLRHIRSAFLKVRRHRRCN